MTHAVIDIGKYHMRLVCEGHAVGQKNEVCAAISALVTSLQAYLESYAPDDGESKSISVDDGKAAFSYSCSVKPNEEVRGAFIVTATGLMQLAMLYPTYITAMNNSVPEIFDAQ